MGDFEQLVTVRQLKAHGRDDGWRVVDCRFDLLAPDQGKLDYLAGHIPAAVYADLDADLAAPISADSGRHPLPDADEFERKLGLWGIDNSTQVVAYDSAGGAIAARLWWMLRWLGHSRVAVLDGGMQAWLEEGGELESGEPDVQAAQFTATANPGMVISTREVADSLRGDADFLLLDARDARRFVGEVEPIDSRAGHVPGARNFPLSGNLTAEGRWRNAADLRAAWREVCGEAGSDGYAVMCGSGVTACHLALSAELAGLAAPRLYVGSWSEWIRDPARPIASGPAGSAADSA